MYILLVDDHAVVLDGLELLLSTFDFVKKTDKATNPEMLHRKLNEQGLPDVILLDIELGKANGVEVCRELKKQYPDIKVIALTSYSDTYTVKSSVKAGFNGYFADGHRRWSIL